MMYFIKLIQLFMIGLAFTPARVQAQEPPAPSDFSVGQSTSTCVTAVDVCNCIYSSLRTRDTYNMIGMAKNAFGTALKYSPSYIQKFINTDAAGALSFDTDYEKTRNALISDLFKSTKDSVGDFTGLEIKDVERQITENNKRILELQRLEQNFYMGKGSDERYPLAWEYWLNDTYQSRRNKELRSLSGAEKNEAKLAIKAANLRMSEIKKNSEFKSQDEALQYDLRGIASNKNTISLLSKEISALENKLHGMRSTAPDEVDVWLTQHPPLTGEGLLDFLIRVGNSENLQGLVNRIVINSPDRAGLLLAEVQILKPKQYRIALETWLSSESINLDGILK